MKLARLTEYGIPERFITRWQQTIGEELLEWQAEAVRRHDLFGSGSLMVLAPTSSGKTFLAEMAATASLMRRRKVVYVAPLKALVAQKYEHLREVFALPPLGFRVVISTRDRRTSDGRLRRGDFDIAVTVYEKFHALILGHIDLLAAIDLVILDEPQLLGDAKRGPAVAAICDALASVAHPPRVLLLAAHLPHAEVISTYLKAPILHVHRRPVELRLGVLHDGHFHFREHNSAEIGDETFPWNDHLPASERPIALLDELAARGERLLVFCPSKADCHRGAAALAERRMRCLELSDDDLWSVRSGPSLAPDLAEWLRRGVAVHHADLTAHQRTLVETGFVQGRVSVVFCTGTLAWGVHLPATVVFVEAEKYKSGPYAGRLVPAPLDRLEFEGMAGRAGRLGLNDATGHTGRGILWSHSECEAELLWKMYVETDCSASRLGPHPLLRLTASEGPLLKGEDLRAFSTERRLLDWVVAALAPTLSEARELAERSPFVSPPSNLSLLGRGRSDSSESDRVRVAPPSSQTSTIAGTRSFDPHPSPLPSRERERVSFPQSADEWDAALARLARAGMVVCDEEGRISSTPRGAIVAGAGISVDTAVAIMRALDAASDFDPALWTALLSTLPEAADAHLISQVPRGVGDLWLNRFSEEFPAALARRFARDPDAVRGAFPNASTQARAMVLALVLDDWMHGLATREIEARYRLPIGRLEPVADTISWMVETAAALAMTLPDAARFGKDLERAAFRVRHGAPEAAHDLVAALDGLLPRQTILDLAARGWDKPQELIRQDANELAGFAPARVIEKALQRCKDWIERESQNINALDHINEARTGGPSAPKEDVVSPILHLDGAACRARMAVQLAGQTVMLRAKSFKYLLALAVARMLTRDGWIAKSDIEPGENQIKYFYQLRRELNVAGKAASTLIENDGNGRYRLALPPQAIRFDLPRLLEHPDWDIRSRAEQLSQTKIDSVAA
jgi:helicase